MAGSYRLKSRSDKQKFTAFFQGRYDLNYIRIVKVHPLFKSDSVQKRNRYETINLSLDSGGSQPISPVPKYVV